MTQFGDLAYQKEEIFLTYEGLLRLNSHRFITNQVRISLRFLSANP